MLRWCLSALVVVLTTALLYAVRPARALDVETIGVIDDLATGMSTLRTDDLNMLTRRYNFMIYEHERLKQLTGCI